MYAGDQFSKLCSKDGQSGDMQNLGMKNHFQSSVNLMEMFLLFGALDLESQESKLALPVKLRLVNTGRVPTQILETPSQV